MIITNETKGSFIQIGPNSRLDITFQYHVNSIQKKCYMYLNIDINDSYKDAMDICKKYINEMEKINGRNN